jgi:HSP20 family protein
MSWNEDFPSWWRRRRKLFPSFEEIFAEFDKMIEEMMRGIGEEVPRGLIRERRLPDGRIVRETGPIVWGYSVTIGPDGKPQIREFGNVKPRIRETPFGVKPSVEVLEEREPLVDVIETEDHVKIIAELPGVEKDDIKLNATEKTLTISVDTERRRYYKELQLPVEVDPESAKALYKNGVLEVQLVKKVKSKPGKHIKIE